MDRLAGKVALIGGGARGQGATETRLFVREGASVVFGDVLDDEGKKVEVERSARRAARHLRVLERDPRSGLRAAEIMSVRYA
jgi:3alpha(or 20beta)-hydroxysteroid dehydrogenase